MFSDVLIEVDSNWELSYSAGQIAKMVAKNTAEYSFKKEGDILWKKKGGVGVFFNYMNFLNTISHYFNNFLYLFLFCNPIQLPNSQYRVR